MNKHLENTLLTIARDKLGVETLETRRSDSLDFHDIAVWSIKDALTAAFRAGADQGKPVVVVTVQGGLVAEVNATAPLTVFVEDWDCPPDKPLVMEFESDELTPDQARRVAQRLAEFNPSEME